jgi:hypothetical protein
MADRASLRSDRNRLTSILVHLLPFLHLCACVTIALAGLQSAWQYLMIADIPVSVIIVAMSYNFDRPLLLFGILGTLSGGIS